MKKYIGLLWIVTGLALASCETQEERRDKFFQLGNLALEDGNFKKAIDLFNESLKVDPTFVFAINNRGVAKIESNHPYEAILDYNQAILLDENYIDALFNRAYAYESVGKYEKCLKDVDRIRNLAPDSAFVYFYKGLVQTKVRDYNLAYKSFQIADSLNPLNPETIINLATIHYFKGELDSAAKLVEKGLELDRNDPNAYNLLGLIQLKNRNYLSALVEVNRALDVLPDEPFFLNNRGFIYLQMDSLNLARRDIDQSILLNPKNAWAYRNKGIYFLKIQEYKQAVRLFSRALEEPDFIDEIYNYLGLGFQGLGETDKACAAWREGQRKNEPASLTLLRQNCEGSLTKSN